MCLALHARGEDKDIVESRSQARQLVFPFNRSG